MQKKVHPRMSEFFLLSDCKTEQRKETRCHANSIENYLFVFLLFKVVYRYLGNKNQQLEIIKQSLLTIRNRWNFSKIRFRVIVIISWITWKKQNKNKIMNENSGFF